MKKTWKSVPAVLEAAKIDAGPATADTATWPSEMTSLNGLHFINDGLQAALHWLLPTLAVAAGVSTARWGWMATYHLALGVVLGVPAGWAAERWGGLRVLWGALALVGAAWVGLCFPTSEWRLWGILTVAGVGFGVFHPVGFGRIALVARQPRYQCLPVGEWMGRFAAIGDVGRVVLSGVIVAAIAGWGIVGPAAVIGALAIVVGGVGWCWLRACSRSHSGSPFVESVTSAESSQRGALGLGNQQQIAERSLARNLRFWLATGIGISDSLLTSGLLIFAPLLLQEKGYRGQELGWFVAVLYGGSLLGKLFAGRLAAWWGAGRSLMAVQMAIVGVLSVLMLSPLTLLDYLWVAILGVLTKSCLPIGLGLTAAALTPSQTARGFGWNQTCTGLAAALSPGLLGLCGQWWGLGGAVIGLAISAAILMFGLLIGLQRLAPLALPPR